MTILSNIENEIIALRTLICNQVKSYNMKLEETNVGIIDLDYSLARHLCGELEISEININNCGYVTIKRKNGTTTTIGRFILEYYSQYDKELKEILENKEYEINHKNKDKLDNRIENLEIVTHKNNIRHSKGLDYKVEIEASKLKKIQEINLNNKSQKLNEEYLKRISGLFYKFMNTAQLDKKLLKCCYLIFKNDKSNSNNNEQKNNSSNKQMDFKTYKLMTNFYTKGLKILLQKKKEYIYKTIVDNNINLLNRYIVRYPYIEQVLKKYNLINKEYKEEVKFDRSNTKNLLLDFYKDMYENNNYVVKEGNILLTVTIKYFFNKKGKYKSFLTLYLLGLLQRQNDISKSNIMTDRYIHTPSFIKIPVYTDDLLKEANKRAKDLLQLKLNRFSYFIIREEFGEEIADSTYKNKQCKSNYKYGLRAKEDIINFIKTDKDIHTIGFITIQEIFEQIQGLNSNRSIKGEEYNKIYNSFTKFISALLLYNTDTKRVLEELDLTYTTLTNKIIQNIKKNQQKHGFNFANDLRPKMKAIVPKKFLK